MSELHAKISLLEEKDLNVYCYYFFKSRRSKVVCFTGMTSNILSEQWYKYRKELLLPRQI